MSKDLEKVDKFVDNFKELVENLEDNARFLKLSKEGEALQEKAMSILRKKVKKLEKSGTLDELNEHLKVKKIINENEFKTTEDLGEYE